MSVICGSLALRRSSKEGRKRHPKMPLPKNVETYTPNITSQLCDKRSDDGAVRLPADNCWKLREHEEESGTHTFVVGFAAILLCYFSAMVLCCYPAFLL